MSKEQQIVLVVYIDFAKAFDVVSHPKLIARLYCYGISVTLDTIFVCVRSHATRIDDAVFDIGKLISGVV